MVSALKNTLLSARDLLVTAGPVALLALALTGLAFWLLDPMPPKQVVLATCVMPPRSRRRAST
jgi:hypothetical protein